MRISDWSSDVCSSDLHQPKVGAAQAQEVLLLLALGLRHHHDALEAHGIGDPRQADAGIAGGAFVDGAAGLERAAADRVLHDEKGGAEIGRASGRERVCTDVLVSVVAEPLKTKT